LLSKVKMKDSRYKLRGTTQSKGITVRSWHRILVVAKRIVEEHALKATQSRYRAGLGALSSSIASAVFLALRDLSVSVVPVAPRILHAKPAHKAIKAR
jgi:hypothetical protein